MLWGFSPGQQKARDNRAAQRISKVQLSNDPVKRQQATQPPPPAPYEPAPMEGDGGFRDPLRSKESEQELEWKLRQVSSAEPHFQTPLHRNQHLCMLPNRQYSSIFTGAKLS